MRASAAALGAVLTGLLACAGGPDPVPPAPTPAPVAAEPSPSGDPAPHPNQPDALSTYGMKAVDWPCMTCDGLTAFQPALSASSSLKGPYSPDKALGPASDAWCEGEDGDGIGATLTIALGRPAEVDALAVWGGYFKSEELLGANNRIKKLRLTTDAGADEIVSFTDPAVPLAKDPSSSLPVEGAWIDWVTSAEPPWHGVRGGRGKPVSRVTLEILEVYPGAKHRDTCIARLDGMIVDPDQAE